MGAAPAPSPFLALPAARIPVPFPLPCREAHFGSIPRRCIKPIRLCRQCIEETAAGGCWKADLGNMND